MFSRRNGKITYFAFFTVAMVKLNFFKKKFLYLYFLLFTPRVFIILHLTYLLTFFFVSSLFCNVFLVFHFFSLYFFGKKYFYLFYTLWIFITLHLTYLYYFFYSYLYSFVFFFKKKISLHFFWKIIIQRLRKWCQTIALATLFYFSATLKINLRFNIFLLTHMIFTIFYYIYVSPFLFTIIYVTQCQKTH